MCDVSRISGWFEQRIFYSELQHRRAGTIDSTGGYVLHNFCGFETTQRLAGRHG